MGQNHASKYDSNPDLTRQIKAGMRMFTNGGAHLNCSNRDRIRDNIAAWRRNGRPSDQLRCPKCHAPFSGDDGPPNALYIHFMNRPKKAPFYRLWCVHCGWSMNRRFDGGFQSVGEYGPGPD